MLPAERNGYLTLGAPHTLYFPKCTEELVLYLKQHTRESDEVFILGDEPGAYWQAGRLPASKYIYDLLFTSGVIPRSKSARPCR